MAKYMITAGCGHTTEVNLQGSVKERQRRIEWLESPSGKCNPCYAQAKRAEEADRYEREVQQVADKLLGQFDALPEDDKAQVLADRKAELQEYKRNSGGRLSARAEGLERVLSTIEERS